MKSIAEILEDAKELYLNGEYDCMCYCCPGKNDDAKIDYMIENIKFFDRTVAINQFGAGWMGAYWWPLSERESRIRYFDYLIEKYSENEND